MPEMDGPALLLKHVRERDAELKVIFVSGFAEDNVRRILTTTRAWSFCQALFA